MLLVPAFDQAAAVTYTRFVYRSVAILLALVLASTSGQVSALHIHAYTDHDHPEHDHGLAAHEHQPPARHHDDDEDVIHEDDVIRLESCDPGQHAVSITMGSAPLPQVHAIDGESATPATVAPLVQLRSEHHVTDVRVHGPPTRTQAAPRAPPLIVPA